MQAFFAKKAKIILCYNARMNELLFRALEVITCCAIIANYIQTHWVG